MNDQVPKHVYKWASKLQVELNGQVFGPMDLIHIICFQHAFKRTCDKNGINEDTAMWLSLYFMRKSAIAALTADLSQKAKLSHYSVKE